MAIACNTLMALGLTSTAALAQYQPVQATGAPAAAAGNAIGFAMTPCSAAGVRVPVAVVGTTIAVAAAAITAGALVEVAATVTQVQTKSAGIAIGRALTAASNAGDLIEVLILPQ